MVRSGLLTAVLVALCVDACCGIIFNYDKLVLDNNLLKYRSSYMYSQDTAPALDKNPQSYISFDFTFTLAQRVPGAVAQVTVLKGVPGEFIGEDHKYCCSRADAKTGICPRVNMLHIPDRVQHEAFLVDFSDAYENPDGTLSVETRGTYSVETKGLYTIMFSFCEPETVAITISGRSVWRNPYGYLTGEYYGFLNFYLNLSIAYLACAFVWAYLCMKNWRELLTLQNCITAVIGLGMIEVMLRYYDFHTLNSSGERNHALMLAGVTFATIKKTVSRMLVLVVCMGYGVVRPNLGETGNKVAILGFIYLIVASVQHTVENLSMHSESGESASFPKLVLLVPVAALDTYFYFWIFSSLRTTVTQLESRGQEAKLALFIRFQRVLIVSVVITGLWALLYVFVRVFEFRKFEWQHVYILDGFWDCLYLGILIAIMVLWRPNKNSQRYAYTQVKTFEQDDEEYGEKLEDNISNGAKGLPQATQGGDKLDLITEKPIVAKSD